MQKRSWLEVASWIAGVLGLVWAVFTYFAPKEVAKAPDLAVPTVQASLKPPLELISKIGPATALRYLETHLGTPLEESESHRSYEKYGFRFEVRKISKDKFYEEIELGPTAKPPDFAELSLSGQWGQIEGRFGKLTIGDVHRQLTCTRISDWNYGGNSACSTVFEVECGGAQYQGTLSVRIGVLAACHYADLGAPYLDKDALKKAYMNKHGIQVGQPMPSIEKLVDDDPLEILALPLVANSPINFLLVSRYKRTAPRGAE